MKRPTKVRVNGAEFKIKYRKFAESEKALGLCRYKEARLEIATGQTQFDTKDTVLHEILHAILSKQGHSGRCFENALEEKYVNPIATGVIGILQDNPELARWLIEPIKKGA